MTDPSKYYFSYFYVYIRTLQKEVGVQKTKVKVDGRREGGPKEDGCHKLEDTCTQKIRLEDSHEGGQGPTRTVEPWSSSSSSSSSSSNANSSRKCNFTCSNLCIMILLLQCGQQMHTLRQNYNYVLIRKLLHFRPLLAHHPSSGSVLPNDCNSNEVCAISGHIITK